MIAGPDRLENQHAAPPGLCDRTSYGGRRKLYRMCNAWTGARSPDTRRCCGGTALRRGELRTPVPPCGHLVWALGSGSGACWRRIPRPVPDNGALNLDSRVWRRPWGSVDHGAQYKVRGISVSPIPNWQDHRNSGDSGCGVTLASPRPSPDNPDRIAYGTIPPGIAYPELGSWLVESWDRVAPSLGH